MKRWVLLLFLCVPIAGGAQNILLEEDFESCTPPAFPDGWKVLNLNYDADSFEVFQNETYNHTPGGDKCARYSYNPYLHADDWFITDNISLVPGYAYRLTYWYRVRSELHPENFEVYLLSSQNLNSSGVCLKVHMGVTDTQYVLDTIFFRAPVYDSFYVGFKCSSDTSGRYLYIDDIKLEFIVENDVSSDSLKLLNAPIWLGDTARFSGFISNRTTNPTGNFWVLLLVNGSAVDSMAVSLNGGETAVVNFEWIPSSGGFYPVSMICEYPEDQIAENDSVFSQAYVYTGPWVEGFNEETFPPIGWTLYDFNGHYSWRRITSLYVDAPACAAFIPSPYSQPFQDWIITPHLKVSGNGDTLSFWYKSLFPYSGPETLLIAVSTSGLDTADFTVIDTVFTDTGSYWIQWHKELISLDPYAGRNLYIAFIYGESGAQNNWGIAIDVVEGPLPVQNDIAALSVFTDSFPCVSDTLTLSGEFANLGLETQYDIHLEVEVLGGDLASFSYLDSLSWGEVVRVDFPDFWIPDEPGCYTLRTNALHEGDEVPDNNSTESSIYVSPTATFYLQDFEAEFPPDTWFVDDVSGTSGEWYHAAAGGGTPDQSPLCGNFEARFNSSEADSGDCTRLASWLIHIPESSFMPYLGFWMYHDNGKPFNLDSLYVEVSVDIGMSFIAIAGFSRYSDYMGWKFHKVSLSDYKGEWVIISFKGKSAGGNDIFIDQVTLSEERFVPAPGDLLINEISIRDSVWIELLNTSEYEISIDGFRLASSSGFEEVLFGDLQPGFHLVVYPEQVDGLDPEGDRLFLIDLNDDTLDIVEYGYRGGAPASPKGCSVCRIPDGMDSDSSALDFTIDTSPTPGSPNDASIPALGTSLVINELDLITPSRTLQMVELFNPTEEVIYIDSAQAERRWYLSDGDTLVVLKVRDSIMPGSISCLFKGLQFDLDIDESDVVYLFDPDMRRVDQLGFHGEPEDGAFQRYPDGVGPNDGYDYLSSGGNVTLFDLTPTRCFFNMSTCTVYKTGFEDVQIEDTGSVYNAGSGTRPHSWTRCSGFLYWGNSQGSYIDSLYPADGDSFLVCAMDSIGYDNLEYSWWYSLPSEGFDLSGYRTAGLEFDIWYHLESYYDSVYVLITDVSLYYPDFYILKAYTGNSNGWIHDVIDISAWCGKDEATGDKHDDIRIALLLKTNGENSGPEGYGFGAAFDNISVTAGGIYLAPPSALEAQGYQNGVINLSWNPPLSIATYRFKKFQGVSSKKLRKRASKTSQSASNTTQRTSRVVDNRSAIVGQKAFFNSPEEITVFVNGFRQTPIMYYVFRRPLGGRYFELIDSSSTTFYPDYSVNNGKWYEYYVAAVYDTFSLNWSRPSNLARARAGAAAEVLLFGDFAGLPDDSTYWDWIERGITQANYSFDKWNSEEMCFYPESVDLYQYEKIIWFSAGPGTSADTVFFLNLDDWLHNKPGRLLLFNRDFAWQLSTGSTVEQAFWENFKTQYSGNYSGSCSILNGVSGDVISNHWSTTGLPGQFGYNDFASHDGEADVVFTFGEGETQDSVACTRYEDPVTGYRVVWAGFDVIDIAFQGQLNLFVDKVLDWFSSLQGPIYTRGDVDADGSINVTDLVYLMTHLFPTAQIPCVRTADFNDDNVVEISDVTYGLQHILPTPTLPPPDSCGYVPWDTLPCDSFPPCGWHGKMASGKRHSGGIMELSKPIKLEDGLYEIPLWIEVDEEIAAFQFSIRYDPSRASYVKFKESEFLKAKFDYVASFQKDSTIGLVGMVSLQLPTDGIAGHIGRGKYSLGSILFKSASGEIDLELYNLIFADKYGYSMYPELKLFSADIASAPRIFELQQSVPNPFPDVTTVRYFLPKDCKVRLCIYDVSGRKIKTLVDKFERSGYKSVKWFAKDDMGHKVPPGTYLCRLETGTFKAVRKLVLIR